MPPRTVRSLSRLVAIAFSAISSLSLPAFAVPARVDVREAPRAVGAVLDLSGWDFRRDGPASLAGEWAFFPGELVDAAGATALAAAAPAATRSVPDAWRGSGAGTYRLRVLLGERDIELGIRSPTVSTAFELDANGVTIARAGRPALDEREAVPGCFTGVVGVPGSPRELDLVVRVSNYEYRKGGMWRSFTLGSEDGLLADKRMEDGLTLVFFGATLATAVVFFLIFRYRRRELDNLYFASFVLTISLRTLVSGDFLLAAAFPSLPFDALIRLFYLSAFALFPLGVLFFGSLFPEEITARTRRWICIPFCVLGLSLAAPLPVLTRSIFVLYPLQIGSLVPLIVFGLGRAVLRRRPQSVSMLVASVVLGAAAIIDMASSSLLFRAANLLYPALAVFIFVQAAVVARRFSDAFDSVERLSGELARANDGLDRTVRERTKELEEAYARIKELSIKDPLTDAYNRRYLDRELVREVERANRYGLPLSVLFCDFDRFKDINDRFGHGAGDEVLRSFSRIAFDAIRDEVDWFARYGGEEFLVVAPGTKPEDAATLAERLRARAETEVIRSEEHLVRYTLSIGVAGLAARDVHGGADRADAEATALMLVARADAAMYAAKAAGRNRVELAPRISA